MSDQPTFRRSGADNERHLHSEGDRQAHAQRLQTNLIRYEAELAARPRRNPLIEDDLFDDAAGADWGLVTEDYDG